MGVVLFNHCTKFNNLHKPINLIVHQSFRLSTPKFLIGYSNKRVYQRKEKKFLTAVRVRYTFFVWFGKTCEQTIGESEEFCVRSTERFVDQDQDRKN